MLNLDKRQADGKLTVSLEGRLDTVTAPMLEECIRNSITDVREMILDCEKLEYISSAGLRVLLAARKTMERQGSMTLRHVNETIMEVFEVTGFADILTIE